MKWQKLQGKELDFREEIRKLITENRDLNNEIEELKNPKEIK